MTPVLQLQETIPLVYDSRLRERGGWYVHVASCVLITAEDGDGGGGKWGGMNSRSLV